MNNLVTISSFVKINDRGRTRETPGSTLSSGKLRQSVKALKGQSVRRVRSKKTHVNMKCQQHTREHQQPGENLRRNIIKKLLQHNKEHTAGSSTISQVNFKEV